MTFPGPGAVIITNEAGEVLGWDYPSQDDPYDPDDYRDERREVAEEDAYETGKYDFEQGFEPQHKHVKAYMTGYADAREQAHG